MLNDMYGISAADAMIMGTGGLLHVPLRER